MAWLYRDDVAWPAGWPLHCWDCWVHPCTQPFRACALQGQTFVCPDLLLQIRRTPVGGSRPPIRPDKKKRAAQWAALFFLSGGEGGIRTPEAL